MLLSVLFYLGRIKALLKFEQSEFSSNILRLFWIFVILILYNKKQLCYTNFMIHIFVGIKHYWNCLKLKLVLTFRWLFSVCVVLFPKNKKQFMKITKHSRVLYNFLNTSIRVWTGSVSAIFKLNKLLIDLIYMSQLLSPHCIALLVFVNLHF